MNAAELSDCPSNEFETDEENRYAQPGAEVVLGLLGTRGTTVLFDRGSSLESYSSSKGEEDFIGNGDGTAEKRIVKPTDKALSAMFTNVSNNRRHTTLEACLLRSVCRWKELNDPLALGNALIKCDNMLAHHRDCYGVVQPKSRVSSDYVRMASVLSPKQWAVKDFVNRSKHNLLDPSFADRILLKEEGTLEHIARKYGKVLLSYKLLQIQTGAWQ